ncbi:MAG: S1C family serine protease [Pseudomonadota bacterium]
MTWRHLFILLPLLVIAACRPTGFDPQGQAQNVTYTPLWNQQHHLKELIEAQAYRQADDLYRAQQNFFNRNSGKVAQDLQSLADGLHQDLLPEIETTLAAIQAITWPADPARWGTVRQTLQRASTSLKDYNTYALLQAAPWRAAEAKRLRTESETLRTTIRDDAPAALARYDLLAGQSFIDAYPVAVTLSTIVQEDLSPLRRTLNGATRGQMAHVLKTYPKDLWNDAQWATLKELYLGKIAQSLEADADVFVRTALVIEQAQALDLEIDSLPDLSLAFVDITNRDNPLDFAADVMIDWPIDIERASLQDLTDTQLNANHVVILDITLARTQRRIQETQSEPSTTVIGTKVVPNPAYEELLRRLEDARFASATNQLNSATTACYDLACTLLMGISDLGFTASSQREIAQIEAELDQTPTTIDEPVYGGYRYEVAELKSTKTLSGRYYVIDQQAKTYVTSVFDIEETGVFKVPYRIAEDDPDAEMIKRTHDSEQIVRAWEDRPIDVLLSSIAQDFITKQDDAIAYEDTQGLVTRLNADKSTAPPRPDPRRTATASKSNDPRFDSVVVIYSPDGGLGSGFFVTPELVLTNWHVVEDITYVELQTYDEQKTFGKVIGRDVLKDLAVIQVQSRGIPTNLYADADLPLGQQVEAIGHPKGFHFSISRGVISSVRLGNTATLSNTERDRILLIQTDTQVNQGNSGGPLFLDDEVIGVIAHGRKDAEGLNFAIHYTEVEKFLADNNITLK